MTAAPPIEVDPILTSPMHEHTTTYSVTGTPLPPHDASYIVNQTNESDGWLPTTDIAPEPLSTHHKGSILKSSGSISRNRYGGTQRDRGRRSGSLTRNDSLSRKSTATTEGAFVNGAGTLPLGIGREGNEEIAARAFAADDALTPRQRSKIMKSEAKDAKRLATIIRQESKVEKQSLSVAIDELAELQKIQRTAVKNETKCFNVYTKLANAFQRLEIDFIKVRTKYEASHAQMNAEAAALETWRGSAREATDRMQEKAREVENLRAMFSVDEREREVRLSKLKKKSWLA